MREREREREKKKKRERERERERERQRVLGTARRESTGEEGAERRGRVRYRVK